MNIGIRVFAFVAAALVAAYIGFTALHRSGDGFKLRPNEVGLTEQGGAFVSFVDPESPQCRRLVVDSRRLDGWRFYRWIVDAAPRDNGRQIALAGIACGLKSANIATQFVDQVFALKGPVDAAKLKAIGNEIGAGPEVEAALDHPSAELEAHLSSDADEAKKFNVIDPPRWYELKPGATSDRVVGKDVTNSFVYFAAGERQAHRTPDTLDPTTQKLGAHNERP